MYVPSGACVRTFGCPLWPFKTERPFLGEHAPQRTLLCHIVKYT